MFLKSHHGYIKTSLFVCELAISSSASCFPFQKSKLFFFTLNFLAENNVSYYTF